MASIEIGDFLVGDGQPCFIISEIGINHNGSIDVAKALIDAAVDAGCNAVKFQKRTVDVVYTQEELERARGILNRKYREPPTTREERARRMRFLQSRGFSTEIIVALLSARNAA